MLRTLLLIYPFLAVYVTVCTVLFVPATWLTRDVRLLYWLARKGVQVSLWLGGVKVRMDHPEYARQHATCVFVSNHVSNLDPPILFMVLPRLAVVLKQALRRIPLLGYIMAVGGFIYVDRADRDSRRNSVAACVATLGKNIPLLIFPEGTRSRDGSLLPFRPGPFTMAIEAQVPIVPITVHGSRALMPKGSSGMRPGTVTVVFHPPVETQGMSPQHRAELMRQVRATMQNALETEMQ